MRKTGRGGEILRSIATAIAVTSLATLPAAFPWEISTTSAALLYVLAVVAASATAGVGAGLAASVLSFVALNYFFTPPRDTLSVEKTEDLVALMVFLAVSGVVGTLLARAVAQRSRAERREREAVLLHDLSTRLLTAGPPRAVLESFAGAVTDLFGLARCEVSSTLDPEPVVAERGDPPPAGTTEEFAMVAGDRSVGSVQVTPASGDLRPEARSVIRTFAGQMGLALERMRLSKEADAARMDAETNRLRAALFSSVTHDLRTPLATITAASTSLLDPGASVGEGDRRELLETIRQEAERLNRMVGNLLDVSRMRAGAVTPEKSPAAIDEVIEGVAARLRPRLDGHDVRLELRVGLPSIPMDVVRIDQVLSNILENAARFSPAGGPITIYAAPLRDGVIVRVTDRGSGIPEENRERVFEPFVRGEGSVGTGLGLAIAQAIIESHDGRIWVEAAPGGGTVVSFELPGRI